MTGTGKTLLPCVLSQELHWPLINISILEVVRGEVGVGEQRLTALFQNAKRSAPCLVFIDEFQAIFADRQDSHNRDDTGSSLSSTLAGCLDDIHSWNLHTDIHSQIIVMAASNEPWAIDPSFLRSGRFGKVVFVGTLDVKGRRDYLAQCLVKLGLCQLSREWEEWVSFVVTMTTGFTGADMSLLCKKLTRQWSESQVTVEDMLPKWKTWSWNEIGRPSVTSEELQSYHEWYASFQHS